jgi:hypothetical protein
VIAEYPGTTQQVFSRYKKEKTKFLSAPLSPFTGVTVYPLILFPAYQKKSQIAMQAFFRRLSKHTKSTGMRQILHTLTTRRFRRKKGITPQTKYRCRPPSLLLPSFYHHQIIFETRQSISEKPTDEIISPAFKTFNIPPASDNMDDCAGQPRIFAKIEPRLSSILKTTQATRGGRVADIIAATPAAPVTVPTARIDCDTVLTLSLTRFPTIGTRFVAANRTALLPTLSAARATAS